MSDVYFFGCIGGPGHYHWSPPGVKSYGALRALPESLERRIDGIYCPGSRIGRGDIYGTPAEAQEQSLGNVVFVDGWTVLAFWDRSVDRRGGCNGAFLARGAFDFTGMREIAKTHFPDVLARIEAAAPLRCASGGHLAGCPITPETLAEWERLRTGAAVPVLGKALREAWAEIERLRVPARSAAQPPDADQASGPTS